MHNLSDEELDRLSREAAEVNQTPVSPVGWNIVSARLDQEMPVAYKDKTLYLRVITDLLLLLTLAYIGLYQPSDLRKQNAININKGKTSEVIETEGEAKKLFPVTEQSDTEATKPAIDEGSLAADKERSTSPISIIASSNSVTHNVEKNRGSLKNLQTETVRKTTDNKTPVTISENKLPNDNINEGKISSGSKADEKNNIGQLKDQNRPPVAMAPGTQSDLVNNNSPIPTQKSLNETATTQIALPDSATKLVSEENTVRNSKKHRPSSFDGITANALQIGVTWSPDFSKVGSAKPMDLGHIIGITAGYQFNRRWSIQSAVLYTKKFYTSEGGSYGKVPGYPAYDPYVKIMKVNAECYMLDVPVNVRYNWLVRKSNRAFVNAGFSSYFMKEEDLQYWYTYYNNPKYKQWTNEANSNYWFAVGNISAGFEQFITPSISVQAEPFFKFSLRDIGYGQVKIKSSGIFLGIKYTPPLHLSKK